MRKVFIVLLVLILILLRPTDVSADSNVAGASAQIKLVQGEQPDYRVVILKNFLEEYNSPLAEYADVFVSEADKNNIDWRLVPSISGVESTFGKRMPRNSYNAYGWANGNYRFTSWEESIGVVSKSLRENYIDNGKVTVNQISRVYAPPSKTWAYKVKYFMKKISPVTVDFDLQEG